MATLEKISKSSKKTTPSKAGRKRAVAYSEEEISLLRKFGRSIPKALAECVPQLSESKRVDWLAVEAEISKSQIYEIIGGKSNSKLTTLFHLADALGYKGIGEFLAAFKI